MIEEILCRCCKRVLKKTTSGLIVHPDTGDILPTNFYGGHVCSKICDMKACITMESSMPGAGIAKRLGYFSQRQIDMNWSYQDSFSLTFGWY